MGLAELKIARRSAMTYGAISLTVALIFLIVATFTGYDAVARFGGAIWVFMLSMIVTMPVVTSRFKRART